MTPAGLCWLTVFGPVVSRLLWYIPVGAYTSDVAPRSMSGKSGDGVAIPPLSQTTLREFACNTTGEIWNELLVLARQPGVVNLGQGYPDYDGSKVAREAAAEAMVDPTKVIIWHLRIMRNGPVLRTVDNTRVEILLLYRHTSRGCCSLLPATSGMPLYVNIFKKFYVVHFVTTSRTQPKHQALRV